MTIIENLLKENEVLAQEVSNMKERLAAVSRDNQLMFKMIDKQNTIEENKRIMNVLEEFFEEKSV